MNNFSAIKINLSQIQMLAENLRVVLNARGMSENELAQALSLPVMTVRRIVSGETMDPRISTLKLIADHLDVSIDALLGHTANNALFITKNLPHFIPIVDWKSAENIASFHKMDFSKWKEWQPIILNNHSLSKNAFALESKPSMQPRFPMGTLFVIDPNEVPVDGDFTLIKMKKNGDLSLRELIIDSPRWQLQPVITGSEIIFYDKTLHQMIGIVVMSLLFNRKK